MDLDATAIATGAWLDAVQRAAYRTVQEALTNITKHAPGARVTVHVAPHGQGATRVSPQRATIGGPSTIALPPAGAMA